jgi:hypothetical protein
MKRFLAFLKLIGVPIGKRALAELLPIIVQVVMDLDGTEESGPQKRARALSLIKAKALEKGFELSHEVINLLIEVAVNAQREPRVDLLKRVR